MSFNYIETTWEPTPAYAVMPDHDVLERSPSPYIPTPPLESMNNTLSGSVQVHIQCQITAKQPICFNPYQITNDVHTQ